MAPELNLHVHFHAVIPNAVWVPGPDGSLVPIHLPPPCDDDVVAIAADIAKRALMVIRKFGDADAEDADDATAETAQLMLAELAKRHREESPRNDKPRRLSAFVEGFRLNAHPAPRHPTAADSLAYCATAFGRRLPTTASNSCPMATSRTDCADRFTRAKRTS